MLLHSVAQRLRQHDWLGVVVELFVVVIGVFLGLQASNWNDARTATREEAVLIERFVRDLEAIELEAEAKVEFIDGTLTRNDDALASLREDDLEAVESHMDVERLVALPGTIERSSTYLELVAGGMRRISDDGLREALVQHDGQLLDAKETQAIRRAQMEPHVERLERLGNLLKEVEPGRAVELSGGSLGVRLALMRLRQIDEAERAKLEHVLKTTQSLLGLLHEG